MTGSFSDEALEQFAQLAAQTQAADFSEGATYDFTRCVRPDGSFYGTRGKCRKGAEAGAKETPAKPVTRDEKVTSLRAKVKEALAKGATRKQLAGVRGDLQGQERMRKIEEQAKKQGKTRDEVIRERNDAAHKKIMARIAERYPQLATKPKPQQANSAELKATWGEAQKAVKAAKAEEARVRVETKGDKSPEANKRRQAAGQALDKAERAALKMQDRFFAASKRESAKAMTPEQRKLEREANKLTKGG